MMLVAHYDPLWLLNVAKCIRHGTPPHRHSATKNKKLFTIYKDIFNQALYKKLFTIYKDIFNHAIVQIPSSQQPIIL